MRLQMILKNVDVGNAFQLMGQDIPQSWGSNRECRISCFATRSWHDKSIAARGAVTDVYVVTVEERRRKYGSLGKTVLQDTLSADLVAEEYPKVSLADKAGD